MSAAFVYRAFYFLIHFIYTAIELISKGLYDFATAAVNYRKTHGKRTLRTLQSLQKRPKHLTVLFSSDEAKLKDVANFVMWSLAAEIPFISFYDYKGELKKFESDLIYEVSLKTRDHVIWHTEQSKGIPRKNGFVGNKIHVKILTEEDGRSSLVEATRTLAQRRCKDITIEEVSCILMEQYEFPDPDVGIVCGGALTLYRYPPWQVRLTEFFRFDGVKDVTLEQFADVLVQFSKCEQRLGK